MSDFTWDRRLVRPAFLRFSVMQDGGPVQVTVEHEPGPAEPWQLQVERPGQEPRRLQFPRSDGDTAALHPARWLARLLCERLGILHCEPSDIRQYRLEPVLPPLLQLSPAGPCYDEAHQDRAATVEAVVAFADLRGFSNWSLTAESTQITAIFDVLSDAVSLILTEYQYHFWKLLGDGVMLVWRTEGDAPGAVSRATDAMRQLIRTYAHYRSARPQLPSGFGASVCMGPVIEFVSSKFFDSCLVRDYLGPVVNLAARLQGLANAGRILLDERVAALLQEQRGTDLRDCTAELAVELALLKGVDAAGSRIFEMVES